MPLGFSKNQYVITQLQSLMKRLSQNSTFSKDKDLRLAAAFLQREIYASLDVNPRLCEMQFVSVPGKEHSALLLNQLFVFDWVQGKVGTKSAGSVVQSEKLSSTLHLTQPYKEQLKTHFPYTKKSIPRSKL